MGRTYQIIPSSDLGTEKQMSLGSSMLIINLYQNNSSSRPQIKTELTKGNSIPSLTKSIVEAFNPGQARVLQQSHKEIASFMSRISVRGLFKCSSNVLFLLISKYRVFYMAEDLLR